ncbi:MAG: ABC transporter permease [Marmoricola sp.]
MISAHQAVQLVAVREMRTRARSKAFRIVLAVTALAFVALPIALDLAQQHPDATKIAVTDARLADALSAAAKSLHQQVSVRTVDTTAEAAAAVEGDDVAAAATAGDNGIAVTVHSSLSDDLRTLFSVAAQQRALHEEVRRLGGDPAAVDQALGRTHLQLHVQDAPDPHQSQKIAVAIGAGLLMYMILMTVGQMVAQGVVEEKSSRVVELLLSSVRPWQLMAGKILGIGVLGVVQLVVPGALAVGVGIAVGQLDISLASSVGTLLWTLAWFVAGFGLYAMVFAAIGALVSRQEDLNGLMLPVMMPLVAGWVVGVSVLPGDPESGVAAVLSWLPPLAPVLMPMRWALGTAQWWAVLASLALTVATSAVMLRVAGRVYRNSVLRSGARVPWREAVRAA